MHPRGMSDIEYTEHLIRNASIKSSWYTTLGISKEECAQCYGCKFCQYQINHEIALRQEEQASYKIAMQGHAYARIVNKS